jgi:hypothetical protein
MTPDTPASQIVGIKGDIASLTRRVVDLEDYKREESQPHHRLVEQFMTELKTKEREQEKVALLRHQENQNQMQGTNNRVNTLIMVAAWVGIPIAIGTLLCTLFLGWLTYYSSHHAELNPFGIFGPSTQSLTFVADDALPQNADIHPMNP